MAFKNKTIKTNPIKIGASSQQLLLIIGPPCGFQRRGGGGSVNKHVEFFMEFSPRINTWVLLNSFWEGGILAPRWGTSRMLLQVPGPSRNARSQCRGCCRQRHPRAGNASRVPSAGTGLWGSPGQPSQGIKPALSPANPARAAARPPRPWSRRFLLVIPSEYP